MSDSASERESGSAALDMHDLYGKDDGSEMDDEENAHYSEKSPRKQVAMDMFGRPIESQTSYSALTTAEADKVTSKLKHNSPIQCLAVYAPKDKSQPPLIITGSDDHKTIVWDLKSGKKIRSLKGEHADSINAVAVYVSSDSSTAPMVITGSSDESVIIWDLDSGDKLRSFKDEDGGGITALAICDSLGKASPVVIVTGNDNGGAFVWDLATATKIRGLEDDDGHNERINSIATFGVYAATGSEDATAIIWNVATGARLRTLNDHDYSVRAVAIYKPVEEYAAPLLITASDDETVIVWDFHSGAKLRVLEGGHTDSITCLSLCTSLDGSFAPLIVTGSDDCNAAVWDLETGQLLRKLEGDHSDYINCVAVYVAEGPDAVPRIITGSDDCTVVIWELSKADRMNAKKAFQIKARGLITKLEHDDCVNAVAIYVPLDGDSPPLIITALSDSRAVVWDMGTAQKLFELTDEDHDDWYQCVEVFCPPEGSKLPPMAIVGCDDGAVIVFDLTNGKKRMVLEGHHEGEVLAIALYNPPADDLQQIPMVVTAGGDKTAVVWNLKTGDMISVLKSEHTDSIGSVAVYLPPRATTATPYVPLVLTASDDASIVVWEMKSGKKVRTIRDEDGEGSEFNAVTVYEPADRSSEPIVVTGDEDGRVMLWDLATGALLRTLSGQHEEGITCLAVYTPQDKRSSPFIVSGSRDHSAVLWDMYTGSVLRTFEGVHDDELMGVAIYAPPDGSSAPYVVTVSDDYHAVIWDLNAAQLQGSIEGGHGASVTAVAIYVPTAKGALPLVITGSSDRTMIVWELATGRKLRILDDNQNKEITALAVYSPGADEGSSPLLVVGFKSKIISIWNLHTSKRIRQLTEHTGDINCLAVHGPSGVVVSGSADNTAIVWNVKTGKKLRVVTAHKQEVSAVALHSYSNLAGKEVSWVVTGSKDKTAVISDMSTGKKILELAKNGHTDRISAIAICTTDSATRVVTGSPDKTIIIWDTLSGTNLRKITCTVEVFALAVYSPPDNPTGLEITASLSGGVLSVWELSTGDLIRTIEGEEGEAGHDSIISMALYTPVHGATPPLAVTGGQDGVVMIWNYKSGRCLHKLEGGHGGSINCVAVYAPEEGPALLVTGDETFIVWDIASGKKLRTLKSAQYINCMAIHAPKDGPPLVLAGGAADTVKVLDLLTGAVIKEFAAHDSGISCMALFEISEPDEEEPVAMVVTSGDDGKVKVWRISDGACKLTLPSFEHTTTSSVAVFSATKCYRALNEAGFNDDVFIVLGHHDNTATVWMYPSGKKLHTLSGTHTGRVTALALSPDPQETPILVTGSADCTAVVWDLITGKVQCVLKGQHERSITSVLVDNSSGTLLAVTSSEDSSVVVWDITTGKDIRSLAGTASVTALAAYHPSGGTSSARIFAASEDSTVKVWADCLLSADYMPLAGSVDKMMETEIAEAAAAPATGSTATNHWSRLREMANEYGDTFWLENYRLFASMFETTVKPTVRDSFFRTFKAALPKVIHLLPPVLSKSKYKSLLEVCIDDNLDIRRVVLDAWVAALNTPNSDYLNQAFHPSIHLSTEVLLKLAESYPADFITFICRLKLIRSHEAVYKSCPTYDIDRKGGLIIEGMPAKVTVDMWSTIAGYYASKTAPSGVKGNQPVTALMIPLVGAADMKMLSAYVDTSNAVANLDIFESEVGVTAFKYAWSSFGLKIHTITTLRYSAFIALYTVSVFLFDRLQQDRHLSVHFWAWALQAAVLLFILYYFYDEGRQFWNENKERVLKVKERLLDRKERAKEQTRRKQEIAEEEKESKYEPGQHRRHFTTKSAKVSAARLRNPALYTGWRFVLANLELKIVTSVEACAAQLAAVGSLGKVLEQYWEDSLLRMLVKHFAGFWNMVDLSVMATVTAGTILRCVNVGETNSSRCVLSVGCVLVWFKVLNFMRPFKHSGPLIAMILRIMQDIQYFVFILAIVLTGFSMAFWLISYPDYSLQFGTIQNAFLNSYLYMLGQNISTDFSETASPELGIVLLVAFMFFMMILMLNLLIALMGNSYGKVQEKGLAEWRLGQASMILEQSYMMSHKTKKIHEQYSSIHVLKYTSLLADDDKAADAGDASSAARAGAGAETMEGDRLAQVEAALIALQKKLDEKF